MFRERRRDGIVETRLDSSAQIFQVADVGQLARHWGSLKIEL
jgi:hypothetical protein